MADRDVSSTVPARRDELRFQRRLWRVERAAWWVQLAIVGGALLGLAGRGPLAHGTVEREGVKLDFERLARHESEGEMTLEVTPALVPAGELRLCADRRWLEGVEIDAMVPEPERTETGDTVTCFRFGVTGGGPARVRFRLDYRSMGWRRGRLGIDGGPTVAFSQWIYP